MVPKSTVRRLQKGGVLLLFVVAAVLCIIVPTDYSNILVGDVDFLSLQSIDPESTRHVRRLQDDSTTVSDAPTEHPHVDYGDSIYIKGDWDGAPIVVEEFKLIFFTSAKVGCTTWKQLFRRIAGASDWATEEYDTLIPWNPEVNGLKYLYDYDQETASAMLTDPDWTRAVFVRDPKERFLSAYLDKVRNHATYLREKCCAYTGNCVAPARESVEEFLKIIYYCDDAHWRPQSRRMADKHWPYVNFVGHMHHLEEDARRLLQKIGAWDTYGATGWGDKGDESMFQAKAGGAGRHHATKAQEKLKAYLTPELELLVDEYYSSDYSLEVLELPLTTIFHKTDSV